MEVNLKSLLIALVVALTLGASSGLNGLNNNQPRVHASSFKKSNYPMIQDKLQSMSNDQLFMASSVVRGTVKSWGITTNSIKR